MNLTEPQRALLSYISAGQEILVRADEELRTKVKNKLKDAKLVFCFQQVRR